MNDIFKERSAAYDRLAQFLDESVKTGVIDKQHHEEVNTIITAEKSGLLYAIEAIRQLPKEEPLHHLFMLLTQSTAYKPLLLSNTPNPEMTFENYVGCDINKLSYKLAQNLVKGKSQVFFDILFLFGNSGQGKTHLLNAIANEMTQTALYTNVFDLEMELARAKQMGSLVELLHWIYQFKAILLDDFESVAGKERLQEDILQIIKSAAMRGIPVVISSTRKISRIPGLVQELSSLLSNGVSAELQVPDPDQMRVIAEKKAGPDVLPADVLDYLTENIKDNIHHLTGAIKQIIVLSQQTETPITIDLARAVAPTEADLHASLPDLEPALDNVFAGSDADDETSREDKKRKADVFKEMLASAQNEDEQCLALQIALSERIKELRAQGETEEIGRLKVALDHLRAGKIREALSCTAM
ncbi:MAG: ATP-binding protein [Deltaproteobacteria bacterium]|nr:ATP-binding protein [Deltaproteobacteria bacterium]